jgi:predicted ATP-dependent Lon-type protease
LFQAAGASAILARISFCRKGLPMHRIALLALAMGFSGSLCAAAAADDCATMLNASIAGAKVPFSATTNISGGATPASITRLVSTATTLYMNAGGKWIAVPMSSAQRIAQINDQAKTTKMTCQHTGDEPVNGEPAALIVAHAENKGVASDNKVWIGKSTGLPLKTESHIAGGMSIITTFDYKNVTPPAGVQ